MRQERLDKILPHIGGSALYRSRLWSPAVGGDRHKIRFCEENEARSVRAGGDAVAGSVAGSVLNQFDPVCWKRKIAGTGS